MYVNAKDEQDPFVKSPPAIFSIISSLVIFSFNLATLLYKTFLVFKSDVISLNSLEISFSLSIIPFF